MACPPLTAKGDGFLTIRRCGPAAGTAKLEGAGEALWNQPEDVAAYNLARRFKSLKRDPKGLASKLRRPAPNWNSVGLEQLVSIKRSKTSTSGEVLDDFGTFFRAPDAMKG